MKVSIKILGIVFLFIFTPINSYSVNDSLQSFINSTNPYSIQYFQTGKFHIKKTINKETPIKVNIDYSQYLGSKISNDLKKYKINYPVYLYTCEIEPRYNFTKKEILEIEPLYWARDIYFSYIDEKKECEKYMAILALFELPNVQPLKDKILNQHLFLERIFPTVFAILFVLFVFILPKKSILHEEKNS